MQEPSKNPTGESAAPIGVLVRDLLMGSRVTAAAQGMGRAVRLLRDPAKLVDGDFRRLVVDLNQPGFLDAAIQWRGAGEDRVVYGFVSHMDQQTIEKARTGGIDHVMANSALAGMLPQILAD